MSRKLVLLFSAGVICLLGTLTSCSRKDDSKTTAQDVIPANNTTVRRQAEVSVPAAVKGKWKSVKISIIDKEANKESFVTIDIGKTMMINGTHLAINVETFLPHFIMDGTTLTSSSNIPKNPAVLLHITENGKEVFTGWLFALYPNTHATQHARYGFGLVDFTPVK